MEKNFEKNYLILEESHPWFVSRRNIILFLLKSFAHSSKVLDIGCSGGALLDALQKSGFTDITGIDVSIDAFKKCSDRGISNVFLMDGAAPTFKEQSFDIIIASDVLEHIANDQNTVQRWYSLLRQNGCLICFVPAFPFLWSSFDEINHHFRRYTKKHLKDV